MPYTPTQPSPTVILGALFLLGNVGITFYSVAGVTQSDGAFSILYLLGVQWALGWWVRVDCLKRGLGASIDQGFYMSWAAGVAVPYHLFKTRGWRGVLVLLGMAGMFVASFAVAVIVYLVLIL